MSDWMELAACLGSDPGLFFPDGKGSSPAQAKAVCAGCEVREECLEHALETGEQFGVWGGLTVGERRVVKRHRRRMAA